MQTHRTHTHTHTHTVDPTIVIGPMIDPDLVGTGNVSPLVTDAIPLMIAQVVTRVGGAGIVGSISMVMTTGLRTTVTMVVRGHECGVEDMEERVRATQHDTCLRHAGRSMKLTRSRWVKSYSALFSRAQILSMGISGENELFCWR